MKNTIITKVENIIAHSTYDGDMYHYEIDVRDRANYGKDRTYINVIETKESTNHYRKFDYGYIDNHTNTYVPGKNDANKNYTVRGSAF